jgi:3-deoxy-D-manno-octulosonic-acid transferase
MRVFYNLFIYLYPLAAWCLSWKNKKAKQWIAGRKTIFNSLSQQLLPAENIIWIHCASLGEFEQGRPLLDYIKLHQPSYKILLTFFSPSGYEIQKAYKKADYVFYLPNDTPSNAKRFMRMVQPKYIFFIKYDFWFNYINQAYKQNIPFYSVSCIFSQKQFYFAWYARWFRKQLRKITCFFTQDQYSFDLLHTYKIPQATLAGDLRFDRVFDLVSNTKQRAIFSGFNPQHKLIVAGSTWQKDEQLLAQLLKEQDYRLILAPHEVHRERIEEIENYFSGCSMIRYSQLSPNSSVAPFRLIIIDVIGLLNSLYRYGDIAYIGGGFGKGIHNILEAATYGKPVIFGTNYTNVKEAYDLIGLLAAFPISNYTKLNNIVHHLYEHPDELKQAGIRAKEYVEKNTGACKRIYAFVFAS